VSSRTGPQENGGCDCLSTTQVYANSTEVVCGLTPAKYSSSDNGGCCLLWKTEQTAAVTLTVLR